MRTLSDAATASLTSEETDEVWLVLVTINHIALSEPIRVVNNIEEITSIGRLFLGLPFEIDMPGEGPDNTPEARLRIDNVDRVIVQTLREIQSPPTVTIEVILASQPDIIEVRLPDLVLRNCSYDALTVEGTLAWDEIASEPIAEIITPARFPSLF